MPKPSDPDETPAHPGAYTIQAAAPVVLLLDEPPLLPAPLRPAETSPPPLLLARLAAAGSGAGRRAIVVSEVRAMGFDSLEYVRVSAADGELVPTAACVALGSREWIGRYYASRLHALDPRPRMALRSSLPLRWSLEELGRLPSTGAEGARSREFLRALGEWGPQRGVMFAIGGPAPDEHSIVSLGSSVGEVAGDGDALTSRILMLAICLHEFYSRYTGWPRPQALRTPRLSDRQEAILRGLARGLTDREIAERLELSRDGVDYHLRRLREMFRVRNRVALVQAAFRSGSL